MKTSISGAMKSSGGAERHDGENIKPWQPWGKAPTTHTLSHFSSPRAAQVGHRRCSSSSSSSDNNCCAFYFLFFKGIAWRLPSGETIRWRRIIHIERSWCLECRRHQAPVFYSTSLLPASCKSIRFSLELKCYSRCPHTLSDGNGGCSLFECRVRGEPCFWWHRKGFISSSTPQLNTRFPLFQSFWLALHGYKESKTKLNISCFPSNKITPLMVKSIFLV